MLRDLLVRVTERQQPAEPRARARRAAPSPTTRRPARLPASRAPSAGWTKLRPAATSRTAWTSSASAASLSEVAGRACRECLAHVGRVVLHREHQHPGLRSGGEQVGERVDAVAPRHDDVEQHHVRLERAAARSPPRRSRPRRRRRCRARASSSSRRPERSESVVVAHQTRGSTKSCPDSLAPPRGRVSLSSPCSCCGFLPIAASGSAIGERQLGHDRRPASDRRLHVEAAAEQADALAHADEAERAVAHALGREADAVVLDQDANRAVARRR